MSSLTAFSFLLFTDVLLCSLCVPRGWNSWGHNPLCCNWHGELWADHFCHLCETLSALWWCAASVGREEAVHNKFGGYVAFHTKEALQAQEPGCLSASPAWLMQRYLVRHCHHCLKSLTSITLLLCVHMDGGRVEVQLGHSHLSWTPFLPDSCHQNFLLSCFFFCYEADNFLKVIVEWIGHGVLKGKEERGRECKHRLNILLYFTVLLCAEHDYRLCWSEATAAGGIYLHGRMGHCLHGRSEPAGNKLYWII